MPVHVIEYIFSLKMSETDSVSPMEDKIRYPKMSSCLKTTHLTSSETVRGGVLMECIVFFFPNELVKQIDLW